MSERKVSVRLAAVGGDKLKADLVSIGRDGQAALRAIETAGAPATQGLTVTANAAGVLMTRLEALAAKATSAANTMRGLEGAGGVVSRINASTGVSSGVTRDAGDIAAYGQALDALQAKFNPVAAAQQRYRVAIAEIEQANRVGALSTDEMAQALGREFTALQQSVAAIRQREAALTASSSLAARINETIGVTGDAARSHADIEAYGQALDATRAKYNPMFAAIQQYKAQLAAIRQAHSAGAISADEMNAAIGRTRQASLASIAAIKGRSTALTELGVSSRMAAFQQQNLLFQLNDIGMSLASGQNPLTVMIQQGSQIAQMYAGQGGVTAALEQTAGLVSGVATKFWPVALAAGVATAAIAGLQSEINAASDVTVSFGDTALAVWQVFRDGVWQFVKPAFDAIAPWAQMAWDLIIAGVHVTGNAIINGFTLAYETVTRVFAALPSAIGAAVIGAANAVLAGVDWMLQRITPRINAWIEGVNGALDMLPDWARPDGRIGAIPEVTIERIDNPYAEDLARQWDAFEQVYSDIQNADPLGDFFDAVKAQATANAIQRTGEEIEKSGGAARKAAKEAKADRAENAQDQEKELRGIEAITAALTQYHDEARNLGKGIGEALVGGFQSAEEAVAGFVRTGKLSVSDLTASIIADFARVAARNYLFAPLSNALSSVLGGLTGSPLAAFVQHGGGMAGSGPMRTVDAANFIHAPRLHNGTPVGLRADEYAAILQRGERVLNRRQTQDYERGHAGGGAPVITIQTRDAQSFRQSRTQIAADISRAVALGRRGL